MSSSDSVSEAERFRLTGVSAVGETSSELRRCGEVVRLEVEGWHGEEAMFGGRHNAGLRASTGQVADFQQLGDALAFEARRLGSDSSCFMNELVSSRPNGDVEDKDPCRRPLMLENLGLLVVDLLNGNGP